MLQKVKCKREVKAEFLHLGNRALGQKEEETGGRGEKEARRRSSLERRERKGAKGGN